jgi:hypothetical protein
LKHHRLLTAFVLALCLWAGSGLAFAEISETEYYQLLASWKKSRQEAVDEATLTGKRILLYGGRYGCPTCRSMDQLINKESPQIKGLIERYYVPWYCDTTGACYSDYRTYSDQLQDGGGVPFFCVIDPQVSEKAVDPFRGWKSAEAFYSWFYNLKSPIPDLADAIASLKALNRTPTPDIDVADIDGDQKIGMAEAIYFLQKAAGLR